MATEKTLGDFRYTITPLPACENLEMLPRIAPLIGVIEIVFGTGSPDTIKAIAQGFPPGALTEIARAFAKQTTVQPKKGGEIVSLIEVLDAHFAGENFDRMFEWLAVCLEVNFASFFRGCVKRMINLLTPKNSSTGKTSA